MSTQPLPIPPDFNPETNMFVREVNGKTYHSLIPAVRWVPMLLANGTAQDIQQAEKTIRAVLTLQERRDNDPHYGNFRWELEDEVVEDLNAVQFALFNLIPSMLQYGDNLSEEAQSLLTESIRYGLEEIQRINVHVNYTNIVLKDITNSCLGGELLEDSDIAQRGYKKLRRWMTHTNKNGIPTEFNSPEYASIAVDVLHTLVTLVRDEETQLRAKLMLYRLALSSMLHIHKGTGRIAGPFSRAYRPTVFAEVPPRIEAMRDMVSSERLPDWLGDVLEYAPDTMQLNETADFDNDVSTITYHSPSLALGVASQELKTQYNRFIALQSNVCIAHYRIPNREQAGVFMSRYILDDKWVGDHHSTPSRSSDFLLAEEGFFYGVQDRTRAIGLYAPKNLDAWTQRTSAKAALIWLREETIDEIWVGENQISSLPHTLSAGETIVVASGDALFAVRPFTLTDLGRDAPIRLRVIDGHLVLELYNYLDAAKTFWEMAKPGSFYQGQPQCGFYLEVAERSAYMKARAFSDVVASGIFTDEVEPPVTYEQGIERLWQVSYERDSERLGIEVDLMEWQVKRRWNHAGDIVWKMLDSPIARQTKTGDITIDDVHLTCGKASAWMVAIPKKKRWIAVYLGEDPAPLKLSLPDGSVEIEEFAMGMVVWDNGKVQIEALHAEGIAKIEGDTLNN